MKKSTIIQRAVLYTLFLGLLACQKDKVDPFTGQPGNPRFNLLFDNEENVDLDLYVRDPRGNVISFRNKVSPTGGQLDVDCLCDNCPQGPSENIFWPLDNSAPKGIYTYWVEYYSSCSRTRESSNYTVTATYGSDSEIKAQHKGALSSGSTTRWTYQLQ